MSTNTHTVTTLTAHMGLLGLAPTYFWLFSSFVRQTIQNDLQMSHFYTTKQIIILRKLPTVDQTDQNQKSNILTT